VREVAQRPAGVVLIRDGVRTGAVRDRGGAQPVERVVAERLRPCRSLS
jgi:hypothetical protein